MRPRLIAPAFTLTAALALTGCYSDNYGYGYDDYGYGYGQGQVYGYGSVAVAYGRPADYGGYYDPYWAYYARRPYWGWYDGYYYPGTGTYIYDRWRRPVMWAPRYRSYWVGRRGYWDRRGYWNGRREWRNNWNDYRRYR